MTRMPKHARAGPACRRPGPSTLLQTLLGERTLSTWRTYDLSPSFTLRETSAGLAAGRRRGRRGWARGHPGGRRATGAAARAGRRLVILEVRRVLELILGPTHFELGHGGIVVARRGGATAARAAARVVRNGLERAHVDGDVLFADAEESTHADDEPEDFALLIEQHVVDVADVGIVRTKHVNAFEL